MVTTGSEPLAQAEVPALFTVLQAAIVELHNRSGRGCVVRQPTSTELAAVRTERQAEALAWTCTRPLPSGAIA
jgi:hypothetical protein